MERKNFLSKMLSLLFPENITCVFCGEDCDKKREVDVCSNCIKNLPYNSGRICKKCGKPLEIGSSCPSCKFTKHYFTKARAPFIYDNMIRQAIHRLKFNGERFIATSLAYFLFLSYKQLEIEADYIVPIPLSENRLKERGYNQAEELARKLSDFTGVDLLNELEKVKETPKQSNTELEDRKRNVENVFKIKSNKRIKNKTIVLVDDVYTTGATVDSASKELKRKGAAKVYVLTVAHTIHKK